MYRPVGAAHGPGAALVAGPVRTICGRDTCHAPAAIRHPHRSHEPSTAEPAPAIAGRERGTPRRPRPVAFGSFRTDRAGRSTTRVPRTSPDYEALVDPIRCRPPHPKRQTGRCPARAAKALLRVLDADNQPVRLVLGTDALRLIE
ncbi:hypothetical protein [Streptomyces sp. NPDC057580]|uniref:hypothetical protein n=1 Tax=Streptomyces sp. NPDC057580 TaxID=3346173 RepID=UPI0036C449FF